MRRTLFISGLLILALSWFGRLPRFAEQAFFAHMILHMGVVAIAAPLIALGIAGGSRDPVSRYPRLFSPIPASVLELLVVWGWHAPALHHMARHSTIGFIAEQGMFFASGLLVWLASFGGVKGDKSRGAAGLVALLLTSMHMTFLGALLALTPRPLYAHGNAFGLTALGDQQLGGAIMICIGGISYLLGGLWLTVGILREREPKVEARA